MIGRIVTPGLYRAASACAGPAISHYLRCRRARGKEDPARFRERFGYPGATRPDGFLLWAHAASVGESLALLPLIAALRGARTDLRVLVTSGTVTSATLLAERLPSQAIHQYVPVDRPDAVRRFLDHWRPDLAVWIESELWPNLVLETGARGIPMVLVNARLSEASAARWGRYRGLIEPLLGTFDRVLAQTDGDAARFRALGAQSVENAGNLKYDAPPLGHDEQSRLSLEAEIAERPFWLAASTHEGEEAAALDVHRRLVARQPDLLTVIAPRHPARGAEIAGLAAASGLAVARRSRAEPITRDTAVYLADTLGELGLFYALADVVFIGGSLSPVGGHNALEAARLGCALIAGPDMTNFAELQHALRDAGALTTVRDAAELSGAIDDLLSDSARRAAQAASARRVAESLGGALARTLADLMRFVPPSPAKSARDHARA